MSVSENDLELLDSYLDDELRAADVEGLRKRLSSEPQLVAAMDDLRSQREMRQQFFSTTEPDDASVERLVKSVRADMNREILWGGRVKKLRAVGSLAACLLVGFIGGYALRGGGKQVGPTSEAPIAKAIDAPKSSIDFDTGPLVNRVMPFSPPNTGSISGNNNALVSYQIVDNSGRVIGKFQTAEQAKQFMEQQRLRTNPQPAPRPNGN